MDRASLVPASARAISGLIGRCIGISWPKLDSANKARFQTAVAIFLIHDSAPAKSASSFILLSIVSGAMRWGYSARALSIASAMR
jgi:hypothetical protein